MTRFLGPDGNGRFTPAEPGRWITVYTDQPCTTLAAINAYDPNNVNTPGAAITGSRLTVGTDKLIPLFWFPNNVRVLWGKLSRGADDNILRLNADYDQQIAAGGGGGAVSSVAGRTGAVVLTADDVSGVGANLSSLASASTARTNLGLGAAALLTGVTDTSTIPLGDGPVGLPGSGTSGSPRDHVHGRNQWAPADHNLLGWTADPALLNSTGTTGTAGILQGTRLHLPVAASVTNMLWWITTAPSLALTTGQCFAALYKADGTLVGVTADQAANWFTVAQKTMPLVGGPYNCPAGDYYWCYWFNGAGTGPGILRQTVTQAGILNVGLAAPNFRAFTTGSGLTTAAPSPLGTQAASSLFFWAALS